MCRYRIVVRHQTLDAVGAGSAASSSSAVCPIGSSFVCVCVFVCVASYRVCCPNPVSLYTVSLISDIVVLYWCEDENQRLGLQRHHPRNVTGEEKLIFHEI